MRGACPNPNREGCPIAELRGGCFSDTDHLYPKRLGDTALSETFIELDINKLQRCRWEHQEKTLEETDELPREDFMRNCIRHAIDRGEITLSNNRMRRIFGADRG